MKSKRAQIFMIDGLIAFTIIIISLGVFFFFYSMTISNKEIYEYTQTLLEKLTETNINAFNNPEVRELFISQKITNIENTLAQQIVLFYDSGTLEGEELAKNLTKFLITSYEKRGIYINVTLVNPSGSIFGLYASDPIDVLENESTFVYSVSRSIIAYRDDFSVVGPYKITLKTWN